MNRLLTVAIVVASLAPARAADMPSRYINALSPQTDALATEMAYYRGVATACRPTDGTNLNQMFWAPRLAAVPANQKILFVSTVKQRSAPIIAQMSGPDRALQCDDALDAVEAQYPSIAEAGIAAEPICWSDVTGMNRCLGTGDDDVLAGVDALLSGY